MKKVDLLIKYPHLAVHSYNKIDRIQQDLIYDKYKDTERTIHTSYIYGPDGTGKTTFVNRILGLRPSQVFKVSKYKHAGKYDKYACQDIIQFDEFDGQIEITEMNDMLNGQPYDLPCRYNDKVACYTKAIFTSNYPLDDLWKNERAEGKEPSFEGFLRRVNDIIYVPEQNVYIWQKGEPSETVKQKIIEQGARYELPPQKGEQLEIKLIPVDADKLPF